MHDRLAQDSESLELVDAALDAGLRGADLNKRLLAFSRRQALQPEQVDVNAAIIGMMKLLRRSLGARVDVRLACGDDIWPVKVDPVQFETAVVNLSLNARDAMPLGGVLTVETANAQLDEAYAACHAELEPGDYVMVAVTDTGTGMTPEVLSRAFDPFFTTKPVGQGTGLGLSMIYGFMKQSGGHTNIYSEPGQGTTVRLYLPRLKEEGSKQAVLAAVPLPPLADHDVVLVVEDNPDMRRIAMRQLTDLGYQVVEAENGERALALITEGFRPDLLFTDVIMPGALDGIALADKVRAHLPGLPVVLSSGFTERTALDIRERDGRPITYALLSKPYRKDDLARIMRSALDAGKLGKTETPS